jgi:hypothetical protein
MRRALPVVTLAPPEFLEEPKKSGGVLREGVAVKFACIAEHRDSFPVDMMCQLLAVSRSGVYKAEQRKHQPLGPRAQANLRLDLEIRAAHLASDERYGAPRVYKDLVAQGVPCGRHRVTRRMRAKGWRGRGAKRFRVTTTQADPTHPVVPNVVARTFAPEAIGGRDRVWGADITYLGTAEGPRYLAVVLDLGPRRVLGCMRTPRSPRRSRSGRWSARCGCGRPHRTDATTPIAAVSIRARPIKPCCRPTASSRA